MKKRVALILLITLIITALACGCKKKEPAEVKQEQNTPQPVIVDKTPKEHRDPYRGIAFTLPYDYKDDFSMSEFMTVFYNDDTEIEIYAKEPDQFGFEAYMKFSYAFLENTVDHRDIVKDGFEKDGINYVITCWTRDAARVIENDKHIYFACDFEKDGKIYSVVKKTNDATATPEEFRALIESAVFFTPTDTPPMITTKMTDNGRSKKAKKFYNEVFSEDAGLSWGLYDKKAATEDVTRIETYEDKLGTELKVALTYVGLFKEPDERIGKILKKFHDVGCVTELTLQTQANADGSNTMYDILAGEYDESLTHFAKSVKKFGHPVLFRPMNEMNGDWCEYSAYHTSRDTGIFRRVYRYIHGIFEKQGASNALFVWNPNERSFPGYGWNEPMLYYPGDGYVDIVGLTAYNTGDYYTEYGERWQTFSELYDNLYAEYCERFAQPLMITEFACAERGGDKRAWVEDMLERLPEYDRIKLAVWWNSRDIDRSNGNVSRDYLIDGVADIFKQKLGNNS